MAAEGACEVWFYHLERTSLDQALPELLEKTLARETTALAELDAALGDAALYAKDPAEAARLTERRARLSERLDKAEAAWLAAAEAYEQAV
jgi:hypothetical protein